MKAGIIAAGLGERLKASYPGLPKPMIPVAGKPLIHWTVAALAAAGAREATLLVNSRGGAVHDYLAAAFPSLRWTFLTQDTASSWESFRLVCGRLSEGDAPFLMSTADALIPEPEAARFAAVARAGGFDAALALTRFVDDEKPLWADVDADGRVRALGADAQRRDRITCGLYALSPKTARGLPEASAHPNLRGYLASLVRDDRRVLGVTLGKTLDIDRPEDIATAERFLKEATPK